MQRRHILTGAGCALALAATHRNALAHHGWSSFDQNRPIYLAGKVKAVKWQNPHAEIVVTVTADAVLPANLASLSVPAQTSSVDGAKVLASASTVEAEVRTALGGSGKGATAAAAQVIGKRVAEKAKAAGVEKVAFDRSGFAYHGRVKALADAAREAGLQF